MDEKQPKSLTKKNLEDHLIEADLHFSIFEPLCITFGLNLQRVTMALNEKHAPKPDKIIDHRALFPLRRHKRWNYNIFTAEGNQFVGIVFDCYRRPYYQTLACPDAEIAIKASRRICELLGKGQCVAIGFKLDEGKAIREREEGTRKNAAVIRRKGGKHD